MSSWCVKCPRRRSPAPSRSTAVRRRPSTSPRASRRRKGPVFAGREAPERAPFFICSRDAVDFARRAVALAGNVLGKGMRHALALALSLVAAPAWAEGTFSIGIMNDQSGPYADLAGPGSVQSLKMAVED